MCNQFERGFAAKFLCRLAKLLLSSLMSVSLLSVPTTVMAQESSSPDPASPSPSSSSSPSASSSASAPTETEKPTETVSVTGTVIYMDAGETDRYQPELHIDANQQDVTAQLTPLSEKYLSTFDQASYTAANLTKADADGKAIQYTVRDAGYTDEYQKTGSYALYVLDPNTKTVLSPDQTTGSYAAGSIFIYVRRTALSGKAQIAGGMTDTSAIQLQAVPTDSANSSYAGNPADSSLILDQDSESGTWSVSRLLSYNPMTGSAIAYAISVSAGLDLYTVTYDNSAVSGHETETETASMYAGGTLKAEPKAESKAAKLPMLAASQPETYSFTVNQTDYHFASDAAVTYQLSAAAEISYLTSDFSVAKDTAFTVPASTAFTIKTTESSVTVTLDSTATGCSLLSSNPQTLDQTKTSITMSAQQAVENITLSKQWEDGALAEKTTTGMTLALQASADNGTSWTTLTAENMATYGYTAMPELPEHGGNNSAWSYNFAKTLYGEALIGTEIKDVIYRLTETSVPTNYVMSYAADNTTLVNTLKNPYSAVKKWADGLNSYATRKSIADWISTITVTRKALNSAETAISISTTDSNAEGYLQVVDNGNSTWTISMPNTLAYDAEGYPYTYWIKENTDTNGRYAAEGSAAASGSYYDPVYLNQGNYASITSGLYTGGTLTNTLTARTVYTSYKVWKDDGLAATIAARPTASVTLYRYPESAGESYETASPVAGATTAALSNTATERITITLPSDGTDLPMYNDDGYRYVYFVKEKLSGGSNSYKQVFVDNGSLSGNDKFLFNGGELDNTITGSVSFSAVKTWVAAARQDVKAKVVMVAVQQDPDTGEKTDYKTIELNGFGAETVSETASFSDLPKYNSNGKTYTYTIEERSVSTLVGTEYQPATEKTVNGIVYFVTDDGYRYRQDTTADADGNLSVTNTLVGNAQVIIQKTFPDGLLADPTTMVYTIYQNGTAIGTKTVKYEAETAVPYTPAAVTVASYEDMDAGSYTGSGLLPRYNASGVQYRYTVQETGITPTGTYSVTTVNSLGEAAYPTENTEYSGEKYLTATASITNSKPGEGMSITVHKTWIDAGDMMYHKDVHLALQYYNGTAWSTIAEGTIAATTDYTEIGVPNTVPAGQTENYQDLYRTWVAAGQPADAAGSFRVVETALGTYSVVADAAVDRSSHPEHRDGYSFVSTDQQNYDVSPTAAVNSGYDFTVSNQRVGVENIELTKDWIDGSNAQQLRPDSITFTVTASESVFAGSTTKTFTMQPAASGNVWSLTISNLQKYDDTTGAVISYSVAETSLNYSGTDYTARYAKSSSHVSYVVGPQHTGDVDTYAFTNRLSGSVTPYMNKYWMDLGESVSAKRPDIYPLLFRTYTDAANTRHVEKMTYQDRDWVTTALSIDWWQCTFVSQPKYTDEGYEYTYYVGEEYSSAILNDYTCSGAYADEPDAASKTYSEYDAAGNQKEKVTLDYQGKTYEVAMLDNSTGKAGTIVNKPAATRTISGTKLWTNLPAEFSETHLPDVTFVLKRYATGADPSTAEVVQSTGTDMTAVLKSGASAFSFPTTVARYDAYGKPYIYIVEETSPTKASLTYEITNSVTNGLIVTNEYKRDQNFSISFTKNWADIPAGTSLKPSTTLTLVRYLKDSSGSVIAGTRESGFATAAANTNANQVTITSDTTAVNWSSLAYYGPNGNPYQYQVEESNTPDGYTVTGGTAEVIAGKTVYAANVSGTYDDTASTPAGSGTASLTNTYGMIGSLKIVKAWGAADYKWNISARPTDILVTLSRKCTSMSAAETVQTVTLNGTATAATWSATVGNLQIYAPNGEPYLYTVSEDTLSGYQAAVISKGIQATTSGTSAITVTNKPVTVAVTVNKSTQYEIDGTSVTPTSAQLLFDQSLSGIPVSITYRFLYSVDGGDWQLLKLADNKTAAEQVISRNTQNGSYPAAGPIAMPAQTRVGDELKDVAYKAFEYAVKYADGTTAARSTDDIADSSTIGHISTVGSTTAETSSDTTAITNTIPMEPLVIRKIWDDEFDRDNLRADLTFTVKRDGKQTAVVKLSTANTAADDPNVWQTTVYVPVYQNGSTTDLSTYTVTETSGLRSQYSASVSTDSGTNWAAGTTADLGDLTASANAWFKNTESHQKISIQTAKVWQIGDTAYDGTTSVPDWIQEYLRLGGSQLTFTLQYRVDNTGEWTDADAGVLTSGTASQTVAVTPETGAVATASWTDLPRYQYTGVVSSHKIYYYRVVETMPAALAAVFHAPSYSIAEINGSSADQASTVSVKNSLKILQLTFTKSWTDSQNAYATRPDSIAIQLQRRLSGTENWESATVPDDGTAVIAGTGWTHTFSDLPADSLDGTAYEYRIVETKLTYGTHDVTAASDGKAGAYTGSQTSSDAVMNTLNVTSLTVSKVWEDEDNKYHTRPQTDLNVAVMRRSSDSWQPVQKNGTALTGTLVYDSAAGTWSSLTFSDLPAADEDGNPYEYRAEETTAVTGYQSVTANPDAAHTVITNKLTTVSIAGTKIWDDDGNKYLTRPADETLGLTISDQNGVLNPQPTAVWNVKDANTWSYQIDGLPADLPDGTAAVYTVAEGTVTYYNTIIGNGTADNSYVLSNQLDRGQLTATFTVRLTKHGSTAAGPVLAEAHYLLAHVRDLDGVTEYYTGISGTKEWSESKADAKTLVTADDGAVSVTKLPIGTYYFLETQSPAGYQLDSTPVRFVLTEDSPSEVDVIQADPVIPPAPDTPVYSQTCQDIGYPAGYYWNAAQQACVLDDTGGYQVPDTAARGE